jgi:hypothetical protein
VTCWVSRDDIEFLPFFGEGFRHGDVDWDLDVLEAMFAASGDFFGDFDDFLQRQMDFLLAAG